MVETSRAGPFPGVIAKIAGLGVILAVIGAVNASIELPRSHGGEFAEGYGLACP